MFVLSEYRKMWYTKYTVNRHTNIRNKGQSIGKRKTKETDNF